MSTTKQSIAVNFTELIFDAPDDLINGWYVVPTNGDRKIVTIKGSPNSTLTAFRSSDSVHDKGQLELNFNNEGILNWGFTCEGGGHVSSHPTKLDVYDIEYFGKHYELKAYFQE